MSAGEAAVVGRMLANAAFPHTGRQEPRLSADTMPQNMQQLRDRGASVDQIGGGASVARMC